MDSCQEPVANATSSIQPIEELPSTSSSTEQIQPEKAVEAASGSPQQIVSNDSPILNQQENVILDKSKGMEVEEERAQLPPPTKQALNEAGSSAVSATANSALTAALSSNNDNVSNRSTPTPSNDPSSSNSKVSPTKKKPAAPLAKQIFISSRNFVPISDVTEQEQPSAQRPKEGGMKRVEKKKVSITSVRNASGMWMKEGRDFDGFFFIKGVFCHPSTLRLVRI